MHEKKAPFPSSIRHRAVASLRLLNPVDARTFIRLRETTREPRHTTSRCVRFRIKLTGRVSASRRRGLKFLSTPSYVSRYPFRASLWKFRDNYEYACAHPAMRYVANKLGIVSPLIVYGMRYACTRKVDVNGKQNYQDEITVIIKMGQIEIGLLTKILSSHFNSNRPCLQSGRESISRRSRVSV